MVSSPAPPLVSDLPVSTSLQTPLSRKPPLRPASLIAEADRSGYPFRAGVSFRRSHGGREAKTTASAGSQDGGRNVARKGYHAKIIARLYAAVIDMELRSGVPGEVVERLLLRIEGTDVFRRPVTRKRSQLIRLNSQKAIRPSRSITFSTIL